MCNSFYLISIDPGNNTGIAIYQIDALTFNIINIQTHVVVLDNYTRNSEHVLLARNEFLKDVCVSLYHTYNPLVLAMETAFLNSRFPKAVMQLSQYTSTIERAFYSNNSFIKLYKYAPKYIKKYIGGGGSADKDAMLVAVNNISELSNNIDLNRLTEHEIDALAVGYITIVHLRDSPHELISY